MSLGCFDSFQIAIVGRILQREHFVKLRYIFLKHLGVFAGLLAGIIVATVLGTSSMKKSESTLIPWGEQRLLLVEVRLDSLTDLDASQRAFIHVACGLAGLEDCATGETSPYYLGH